MISFKFILGVLFILLVSIIAVLGVVAYENNKTSLENAELVRQAHEVLDKTEEISAISKDLQLEGNGYFIIGDSTIIRQYLTVRDEVLPHVNELKALTNDNSVQQARINSLKVLIDELITYTNSGVTADNRFSIEDLNNRIIRHFQYRERIREIIGAINGEEERLLVEREEAYRTSIAAFNKTFFLLIGGIGIVLATTFFSIRYSFNKRIKMQDELKKANELFINLFYESPIGILISRLDTGVIIDCNNEFSDLIKSSKSELIGKTAVELDILPSSAEREKLVGHANVNTGVRDLEVQLKPKNSEPIWVSISMQPIQINNEDCLLSAILDMTAHKQAEERVKQALATEIELNKLKSNFVTLASHEFRTPLTTILSSAFLLDNYASSENKEKVGKHISRIKASVNLLTSILDEFLSLTKIEEGKIQPKTERINLRETLEALCQNLKPFARPGQKIIYKHSGDEQVYSDPVLLGNIVNNLVSNAIKYSDEGGDILISSNVNGRVHLSVKDSGIGISKEDQEHLFERFFRASNAGNIQGTGLGLHIMKHYVDMLHGSIQVQSEPGKGSQFDVTFEQIKPAEAG